jgi:7-cyano-7-deazaguanine synthase
MHKKALVIHSGGLDSSLCLSLACQEFGQADVLSVSFSYHQRHAPELVQAAQICADWNVDHIELDIDCLQVITKDALTDHTLPIEFGNSHHTNTLTVGRNGLMARLGAIHANYLGAHCLYMGVIEVDGFRWGYRDCSREYFDLKQNLLRIDLNDPHFEIRTPLVHLQKKGVLALAYEMGILSYLLDTTISCYNGIRRVGCQACPSCTLRNHAIQEFLKEHPTFDMPYKIHTH